MTYDKQKKNNNSTRPPNIDDFETVNPSIAESCPKN